MTRPPGRGRSDWDVPGGRDARTVPASAAATWFDAWSDEWFNVRFLFVSPAVVSINQSAGSNLMAPRAREPFRTCEMSLERSQPQRFFSHFPGYHTMTRLSFHRRQFPGRQCGENEAGYRHAGSPPLPPAPTLRCGLPVIANAARQFPLPLRILHEIAAWC